MLSSFSVKGREKEEVIEAVNRVAAAFQRLGITPSHVIALGLREFMRWLGELLAWGRGERKEKPSPISEELIGRAKEVLQQALERKWGAKEEEECRWWVEAANAALDYLATLQGV